MHYYDPSVNPPPPPSVQEAAWEIWKRSEILPRTDAICAGAVIGKDRENLCFEMMEMLGKWQPIANIGLRAPLCHDNICWRQCDGSHTGGDDDGFNTCRSIECAQENCFAFLKLECAPVTHAKLDVLWGSACTLTPPSPPRPPGPPPSPPLPPYSPPPLPPPPFVKGSVRMRDEEQDWMDNCTMVHYNDCLEAVKQHAAANPGYHSTLRISQAPCEGLADEQSCFVGCSYGSKTGGEYRFLLSDIYEEFKAYNVFRCRFSAHPLCLCGNAGGPPSRLACTCQSVHRPRSLRVLLAAPPPPFMHPPPPPTLYQESWSAVEMPPNTDAFRGKVSAMIKRVSNGRTINPSLRASKHTIYCPGGDDCSHGCARACGRCVLI